MNDVFATAFVTWVWAPLFVGFILWLLSEIARALRAASSRRRHRRARIVTLMGRAESLVVRAVRDGLYDEAYVRSSSEPLAHVRQQYDEIVVEALALFEEREGAVSYWAAVEFYAGFDDPLRYLDLAGTPRRRKRETALLYAGGAGTLWYPPRSAMLVGWAQRRGWWAPGNRGGPWVGDSISPGGDKSRHDAVIPNSCGPGDILMPPMRKAIQLTSEHYAPFIRESGL